MQSVKDHGKRCNLRVVLNKHCSDRGGYLLEIIRFRHLGHYTVPESICSRRGRMFSGALILCWWGAGKNSWGTYTLEIKDILHFEQENKCVSMREGVP